MSYWLIFAALGVVVIGVRLAIALVVIYFLTPSQTSCIGCDGETLAVAAVPGLVRLGALLRVERRWCTCCGRMTLIRAAPAAVEPALGGAIRAARTRAPRGDGGRA